MRIITAGLESAHAGYDAVHIRTVADRAGVATSTVYQYFSSKDDLLAACLQHWLDSSTARARDRVSGIADPYDRLVHLADAVTCELWTTPLLADALMRAYLSADSTAAQNVDSVRDTLSRMMCAAVGDDQSMTSEIGDLVADLWVAHLLALVQNRADATDLRHRLQRVVAMIRRSPVSV
jgi:AcrR family transcriptional regulator